MAVTYMEIDTEQLHRDIQVLREQTAKAAGSLEELRSELKELHSMWKGMASEVFHRQAGKDCSDMEALIGRMQELAECMEYARREYSRCEGDVIRAVEAVRV
ncbi:MAG: WXG100 family type VII secretion target [Clostridiales bacterium]|nr:WXG100 family type VII secretion target [Clostridiales bacterium]